MPPNFKKKKKKKEKERKKERKRFLLKVLLKFLSEGYFQDCSRQRVWKHKTSVSLSRYLEISFIVLR